MSRAVYHPAYRVPGKNLHILIHIIDSEKEIEKLLSKCELLETVGSNITVKEYRTSADMKYEDPKDWETLIEIEKRMNHDPGLVNPGYHIILAVQKPG